MNIGTIMGLYMKSIYRDYSRDPLPHSPLSTSKQTKGPCFHCDTLGGQDVGSKFDLFKRRAQGCLRTLWSFIKVREIFVVEVVIIEILIRRRRIAEYE